MSHSIAFTKWFLNKHRQSGIFTQNEHFEFVLSQLDQSSWDEFSASNIVEVAKSTADVLITQLVEKMPPVRAKNANKKTTKKNSAIPPKFRVDAATSTNEQDSSSIEINVLSAFSHETPPGLPSGSGESFNTYAHSSLRDCPQAGYGLPSNESLPAIDSSVIATEPAKKKRGGGRKPKVAEVPAIDSSVEVSVVEQPEPTKKKKGGGGRKPKVAEVPVIDSSVEVPVVEQEHITEVPAIDSSVVATEQPEPAKKKKGGGRKPKVVEVPAIDSSIVEQEHITEVPVIDSSVEVSAIDSSVEVSAIDSSVEVSAIDSSVEVSVVEQTEPAKKKKGGGRKPKVAVEPVIDSSVEVSVVEQTEPAKKKKGGGRKPKVVAEEPIVEQEHIAEIAKKKRGPKKNNPNQIMVEQKDEVVIPVQEQLQLEQLNNGEDSRTEPVQNDNELTEESFDYDDESVDLIEHYVNDVLYYVDANGNWFDTNLNEISSPI